MPPRQLRPLEMKDAGCKTFQLRGGGILLDALTFSGGPKSKKQPA